MTEVSVEFGKKEPHFTRVLKSGDWFTDIDGDLCLVLQGKEDMLVVCFSDEVKIWGTDDVDPEKYVASVTLSPIVTNLDAEHEC